MAISPDSTVSIARPMCWSIISDSLSDPAITSSLLLDQLKEESGDMWPQCNDYFSGLVNVLHPEKDFNYDFSHKKFVGELLSRTGMKYDKVRNMTVTYFFIHITMLYNSSSILSKVFDV